MPEGNAERSEEERHERLREYVYELHKSALREDELGNLHCCDQCQSHAKDYELVAVKIYNVHDVSVVEELAPRRI